LFFEPGARLAREVPGASRAAQSTLSRVQRKSAAGPPYAGP
jgi:hypothetical protein